MLTNGDVVFGPFPIPGKVLQHYAVVLAVEGDKVALAYVTSVKDDVGGNQMLNRFSAEDQRKGGFTRPSRWVAARIAVVPSRLLEKKGRISDETWDKILVAFNRASRSKGLEVQHYKEDVNAAV